MTADEREIYDAAYVEELRAAGFRGRKYDELESHLVAYAYDVLDGKLRAGTLYAQVARRTFALNATESEVQRLRTSAQDRDEVVSEALVKALVLFHTQALVNKKWKPEGGASLTTYFVGACIQCMPNAFRKWRRSQRTLHQVEPLPPDLLGAAAEARGHPVDQRDLVDQVADRAEIRQELDRLPDDLRAAIIRLAIHDEPMGQVAASMGITAKALSERLRRYQQKRRKEDTA